jgi:hydroxymethylbilane synthase
VPTEACLRAERAFLRRLEGGCSIPVFGLATLQNDELTLTGGVVSLDGGELLREQFSGPSADAEQIGHDLAESILAKGGDEILRSQYDKTCNLSAKASCRCIHYD